MDVAFYVDASSGTTDRVMFRATQGGNYLLAGRRTLASNSRPLPLLSDCVMELSCQGRSVVVKDDGSVILEHELRAANDHTGFWIGGGWDSGATFTRLQVTGRLDPAWLASALEAASKPE
jgi:hypothetical protein